MLSRIDGMVTTAELCSMSPLGTAETLAALAHLLEAGLISLASEPDDPWPISFACAAGTPEPVVTVPWTGVCTEDASFIADLGPYWYLPGQPFFEPGESRFGRFQFALGALTLESELEEAERQELVFLDEVGPRLDHYEFFRLEPTEDRGVLRHRYHDFLRRLHPDRFFGREVGAYTEALHRVATRATKVMEVLLRNTEARSRYHRAVGARNAAWRQRLRGH